MINVGHKIKSRQAIQDNYESFPQVKSMHQKEWKLTGKQSTVYCIKEHLIATCYPVHFRYLSSQCFNFMVAYFFLVHATIDRWPGTLDSSRFVCWFDRWTLIKISTWGHFNKRNYFLVFGWGKCRQIPSKFIRRHQIISRSVFENKFK